MSNSSYAPFSMMGKENKGKVDAEINAAFEMLDNIRQAPHAAKENLMKTDFKVASTILNFVGRILQAESAMVQAITVLAERAGKSSDFRDMISDNLPGIMLPAPKAKK